MDFLDRKWLMKKPLFLIKAKFHWLIESITIANGFPTYVSDQLITFENPRDGACRRANHRLP